jgi:hypothetical protein
VVSHAATVDQREGTLSSYQSVTTDGFLGVNQVFVEVRAPHVSHDHGQSQPTIHPPSPRFEVTAGGGSPQQVP